MLDIQVERSTDYTVCRPVGELDAYTVGQFRESLPSWPAPPAAHRPLAVPFMDSAGLGALIGGIRRAREAGGDVAVACSRPTLTRLLHTTGFDRIVPSPRRWTRQWPPSAPPRIESIPGAAPPDPIAVRLPGGRTAGQ